MSALAAGLTGMGFGFAAWLRPMPHGTAPMVTPSYTAQQVADAKSSICESFNTAKAEIASNTHRPAPVGSGEIGTIAVGTNGRLALYVGGDFLLDQLETLPATPSDLAHNIRSLAESYKKIAVGALNNESNVALDPLRQAIDADIARIDEGCK